MAVLTDATRAGGDRGDVRISSRCVAENLGEKDGGDLSRRCGSRWVGGESEPGFGSVVHSASAMWG